MQRVVIPIMGFTQTCGRETGMERLWKRLRAYSSPLVCVYKPMLWDSDWKDEAALLRRQLDADGDVVIVAYSWGAGWGCMRLAEALDATVDDDGKPDPIMVRSAVLADPVYRSPWLPSWCPLNPLSMTTRLNGVTRISVPPNVAEVWWTRQRINRPRAHDLAARSDFTVIHPPMLLKLPHEQMDDSPLFQELAVRALARA